MLVSNLKTLEMLLPGVTRGTTFVESPHTDAVARSAVEAILLTALPTLPANDVLEDAQIEAMLLIALGDRYSTERSPPMEWKSLGIDDIAWEELETRAAERSRAHSDRVAEIVRNLSDSDRSSIQSSVQAVRIQVAPLIRFISADLRDASFADINPDSMEDMQAVGNERYGGFWGCLFSMGLFIVVTSGGKLLVGMTLNPQAIGGREFWNLVTFFVISAIVFAAGTAAYHMQRELARRSKARKVGPQAVEFYRVYRERRRINGLPSSTTKVK